MMISTGLVLLMVPALGFFQAGLLRRKNSLSILMQTFSGLAILSVLWFVIGFTLVFSPSQGGFIGGFDWFFFEGVPVKESLDYAPTIPGVTFATYQMMFAVITPLLITGAFAERMTWNAYFVFIIAWSIFIYYPLAHWVWGDGWLAQLGVADFAGGIVIHTSAGMGAIAAALVLGRRSNFGKSIMVSGNVPLSVIGAAMLWFGWFGFNAGSALSAGPLAGNTLLVSQIASATSAMVWIVLSWRSKTEKPSITAVITGAIAGLAGVTPASGFISAQGAFFLGIAVGLVSYFGLMLLKWRLKVDDALDVGSVHGLTGIVGSLAVGLIASSVINPDGPNGLLYGNAAQLGIQALGVVVAAALGFGGTVVIMKVINAFMNMRVPKVEEEVGLDITEQGETAYGDEWGD